MNVLRAVQAVAEFVRADVAGTAGAPGRGTRPWEAPVTRDGQPVTFRFGLTGRRWGANGPVTLLAHDGATHAAAFRHVIGAVVASGQQVIALDAMDAASPLEHALALSEAAVEIPDLDGVIGHGAGAAAVAIALANGLRAERAVLIAPPASVATVARQQRTPALVVHDADDATLPFPAAAAVAEAWPGARFLATGGLGQRRLLGDANVVHGIAEFLRGHDAGVPARRLSA